jgi:hypothetical protein
MQPLSKAFLHLKEKKKKKKKTTKLYSSLSVCSLHKMSSAFRTLTLQLFLQFKIPTFITFFYVPKTLITFSLEWCRNQFSCTTHWNFFFAIKISLIAKKQNKN